MAEGAETRLVRKMRLRGKAVYGPRLVLIKYHGGMYSQTGVSDLLGCLDGVFVAAEVKAPESYLVKGEPNIQRALDEGPTTSQRAFIKNVQDAGGVGGVVASVDGFMALLARAESLG